MNDTPARFVATDAHIEMDGFPIPVVRAEIRLESVGEIPPNLRELVGRTVELTLVGEYEAEPERQPITGRRIRFGAAV
jgi:hypothetical protein